MILLAFIDCWPCPCQPSLQREREIEADNAVVAVVAEAYRCCPSAVPPAPAVALLLPVDCHVGI